ncbi:MAG: hypothetical protein AAGD22_17835 [Verrucomicrobiota bacterium]
MNRKVIAITLWITLAAVSFALGWFLRPATLNDTAAHSDATPIGKSTTTLSILDTEYGSSQNLDANDPASSAAGGAAGPRGALSTTDIDQIGQTFKESLDPIERRRAFSQLLDGLTNENALEIRSQLEHLRDESPEFREFHFAWGKIGGEEAVLHGADTPETDMAATIAGWASASPDAALQWLETLKMVDNPDFEYLLKDRGSDPERLTGLFATGIVQGLAISDSRKATDFVVSMADTKPGRAEDLIGIVTNNVLRSQSPTEAAAWAETLPEGAIQSEAMGRIAGSLAREDPAAAAEWATEFVYQEKGGRIVYGIANQWAREDSAAAANWLQSLGDEAPGRNGAFYNTFERWAGNDPVAASQFLTDMPTSEERDAAISGLVSRHRWEDPVSAIVWADSISSEKQRLETITRAGQAWTRLDPNAAAEWAVSSGLPEKLQKAIINPPKRGRR